MSNKEKIAIPEIMKTRYSKIAETTIKSRALPDIRDGLKPVQRRILYVLYDNGYTNTKPHKKNAKIVGDVMGKFHPRGDSSIYGALINLSRDWQLNMPLVDVHGNNGSVDGDPEAQMRYTEGRLSHIASNYYMEDLNSTDVVTWAYNYDDTLVEPTVLPVKVPNLLLNGSNGIAMSYATKILPHNLTELMDVLLRIALDKDVDANTLLGILPAPDFPTGGVITNGKELSKVMLNGQGSITVRSNYKIEKSKKAHRIIFTDVPYQTKVNNILTELEKKTALYTEEGKKNNNRIPNITSIEDESDKTGIRIVVNMTMNANANEVLSNIFSGTSLQKSVSMNNVAILNGKPVSNLNFIRILKEFHKFRMEVTRKVWTNNLTDIKNKIDINEGIIKFCEDIPKYIKLIRESDSKKDSIKALINEGFNKNQSTFLVEKQIYTLNKGNFKDTEDKLVKLYRKKKAIEKLLSSDENINKYLIKEYKKIRDGYPSERKTSIIMEKENWKRVKTEEVLDEDVYVSVTSRGNVKRSSVRSFSSTKDGFDIKGNTTIGSLVGDNSSTDEDKVLEDNIVFSNKVNGRDSLILITNKLNYLYVPVDNLDEFAWKNTGKNLSLYGTHLDAGEVISAVVVDEYKNRNKEGNILLIVDNGGVKVNSIESMRKKQQYFKLAPYTKLKGDETERLFKVYKVPEKLEGYLGFENEKGNVMFFNIAEELSVKGKVSNYITGTKLPKGTTKIKDADYSLDKLPIEYKYQHELSKSKVGKKREDVSDDLEKAYQEYLNRDKTVDEEMELEETE